MVFTICGVLTVFGLLADLPTNIEAGMKTQME